MYPNLGLQPDVSFISEVQIRTSNQRLARSIRQGLAVILTGGIFTPRVRCVRQRVGELTRVPCGVKAFCRTRSFFHEVVTSCSTDRGRAIRVRLRALVQGRRQHFPRVRSSNSTGVVPIGIGFQRAEDQVKVFRCLGRTVGGKEGGTR